MSLSVVISTHNRSKSLARTLASVRSLADELIVVDSGSTDDTVTVAQKYTPHVYSKPNNLMLNVNKNFGFTKATSEWILNLDDDEEVTDELAKEIRTRLRSVSSDISGFWIPRKNIIFGRWIQHGLWWPDRQLRLFRRGKGSFPQKHVHEYIAVTGPTATLLSPYIHHNYDSIAQYLEKMQVIYIENEVQKYVNAKYRVTWPDAIRFPVSDFLKIYFAQSGYKDGLHGLVLSILQSFYSFIIFAKLWERERFPEQNMPLSSVLKEFDRSGGEVAYWKITSKMTNTTNPVLKVWYKLLRRYGRSI